MGGADEFGDFVAEFCCKVELFGLLLGLKVTIEGRNDVAVDLYILRG